MDRIGSLYVDNNTGISYRLTGYYTHYMDVAEAQVKAAEEGRDFTKEDYDAVVKRPNYSMFSITGGAGSVDGLPSSAQRVWQPAQQ